MPPTPEAVPDLSALGGMMGQPRQVALEDLPLEGLWQNFGAFKKDGLCPMGYPQQLRRLFAPVDNVHGAIVAFCNAARVSLCASVCGWDDNVIDELFRNKLEEDIPVQLSLDKIEGGDEQLLKRWSADQVGNSIAIASLFGQAASVARVIVIDGIVTIQLSGEECTFTLDPVFAAETRARLDIVHDDALVQMVKS